MKNTKYYKGIYFSDNLNNNKKSTNNLFKKSINKNFFEYGAHFKYSSLYHELQKLYKIQNYSLPKKKLKKRINSEKKNKNKNKYNIQEKLKEYKELLLKHYSNNKPKFILERNNNKNYITSQVFKSKSNAKYSFLNSNNIFLKNNSCDNIIKKDYDNKLKNFHTISIIKRKSKIIKDNKNNKNFQNIKVNRKKYSTSFDCNIKDKKQKNKNLKINNKINNWNINKSIIRVSIKIYNSSNNNKKKIKNSETELNIKNIKNKYKKLSLNNSLIYNRNKIRVCKTITSLSNKK